jgi:hypothetical protein
MVGVPNGPYVLRSAAESAIESVHQSYAGVLSECDELKGTVRELEESLRDAYDEIDILHTDADRRMKERRDDD